MSEVIRLTAEDDNASLRARVDATQGESIVVYVPKGVPSLRNQLSLKLLDRQAERLGKDLVIIAEDLLTREMAEREGLLVLASARDFNATYCESLPQMETSTEFVPPRNTIRGAKKRSPFALFFGMAIVAWIGSYLLLPSVTITMVLATTEINDTVNATISRRNTSLDIQNMRVPAKTMQVEVSASNGSSAQGQKNVPEASSEGELTLVNKTGEAITVTKGTKFGTSLGVQFATRDDALLPAGVGSATKVAIVAVEPGTSGNIDKLAINQPFDSQLTYRLTALNESPTQGGKDKEVKFIRPEDREDLKRQLLESAKMQGLLQIVNMKKPNEIQFTNTASVEILEETFDRQDNDESETVELRLRARITVLAVESRYLEDIASQVLTSKVRTGYRVMPGTLETANLEILKQDADSVSIRFLAKGKVAQAIDEDRVRSEVSGKMRSEVAGYLVNTYTLARKPEIEIKPDWLPILPHFGWRSEVKIGVEK